MRWRGAAAVIPRYRQLRVGGGVDIVVAEKGKEGCKRTLPKGPSHQAGRERDLVRIIDITGPIENGMWTYGPPWPEVRIEEIAQPDWVPFSINSWKFSLAGQSGTYLQTGLHFKRGRPPLIDISVESLVHRDAVVLKIEDFEARFADEAACWEYLVTLRWPEGLVCPRCQRRQVWPTIT